MNLIEMLKMNLQFFSQDDTGGSNQGGDDTTTDDKTDDTTPPDDKKDDKTEDKDTKTFTQAELDDIVAKRVARAEKDKQDAIDEAKKLAKMNADEKQQYELEKLQKENKELKASQNRTELGKEATKILAESGIVASDAVLDFVVREDAETTSQAVKAFSELVDKISDDRMKEKLKGTSPKKQQGAPQATTKEAILAIKDGTERIKAIQANPQLFK